MMAGRRRLLSAIAAIALLAAPMADLGRADDTFVGLAFAAGALEAQSTAESAPAAESPTKDGMAVRSTAATPSVVATWPATQIVGRSVRGRPITMLRFGRGTRRILIVGGIHGNEAGAPVAKAFVAYLKGHRSAVPSGTEVHVIAVANPDGYALRRRANARGVDLNRNFASRTWRAIRTPGRTSGPYAGSEPETKAIARVLSARRYVRVVSLHSSGGIVGFAGPCGKAIAQRIARAAHTRVGTIGRPSAFPGSMGHYVPERFGIPIVTWELSSRRLTAHVRAGLATSLH